MDKRDEIKNNPFLTPEEKESSLNLIAMTEVQKKAVLESDKSDAEKSSDLNYYDLIIEEIINKSKRIADKRKKEEKKNREKEKAEVKNKLEVLSYLKNENGEKIYSKAYLKSMSNEKIKKIYNEFERKNPSLLKKIRKEIVRPRVYKGNINKKLRENHEESNQNIKKINNREVTVSDIAKSLGTTPEVLIKEFKKRKEYDEKLKQKANTNKPKKRKNLKIKRLDAYKFKATGDDLDGQKIEKEEDGSRFTKVKSFWNKYKKVIIAAAVLGALGAAVYYAMKQGDASTVHDTITSMKGAGEVVKDTVVNNVPDDQTSILDNIMDKTDVGNIDTTYFTNDDAANHVNGLNPNEWHQNNILGVVTGDNERLPASSVQDILEYIDQGYDLTSIEVGGPNDAGINEIDGHVTQIDGISLKDIIKERLNSTGGKIK